MTTRPTKIEIAEMKTLHDMGHSPRAIGRQLKRSNHTVTKYLAKVNEGDLQSDPELQQLVRLTKEKERERLEGIWLKASKKVSDLLDKDNVTLIPCIAAMDRSFQQLRLVKGEPTEISLFGVLERIDAEMEKLEREKRFLES